MNNIFNKSNLTFNSVNSVFNTCFDSYEHAEKLKVIGFLEDTSDFENLVEIAAQDEENIKEYFMRLAETSLISTVNAIELKLLRHFHKELTTNSNFPDMFQSLSLIEQLIFVDIFASILNKIQNKILKIKSAFYLQLEHSKLKSKAKEVSLRMTYNKTFNTLDGIVNDCVKQKLCNYILIIYDCDDAIDTVIKHFCDIQLVLNRHFSNIFETIFKDVTTSHFLSRFDNLVFCL